MRNAYYMIAFKNPRGKLSMRNVLLQAFPSSWQEIVDVFRKLTEKLFENPRDQLGMRDVLLQAFPSSWQEIMDVFRKLTEKPSENPASEDSTES